MKSEKSKLVLGKKVDYESLNRVKINLPGDEYESLIIDSHNAGFSTVGAYLLALAKPCAICGNDKVQIEFLKRDLRSISNVRGVHLMIYSQSSINSNTEITPLSVGCEIASMLRVSTQSKIYTPKRSHTYSINTVDATITVFENNVRGATVNCVIKNNTLYPL